MNTALQTKPLEISDSYNIYYVSKSSTYINSLKNPITSQTQFLHIVSLSEYGDEILSDPESVIQKLSSVSYKFPQDTEQYHLDNASRRAARWSLALKTPKGKGRGFDFHTYYARPGAYTGD